MSSFFFQRRLSQVNNAAQQPLKRFEFTCEDEDVQASKRKYSCNHLDIEKPTERQTKTYATKKHHQNITTAKGTTTVKPAPTATVNHEPTTTATVAKPVPTETVKYAPTATVKPEPTTTAVNHEPPITAVNHEPKPEPTHWKNVKYI